MHVSVVSVSALVCVYLSYIYVCMPCACVCRHILVSCVYVVAYISVSCIEDAAPLFAKCIFAFAQKPLCACRVPLFIVKSASFVLPESHFAFCAWAMCMCLPAPVSE